MPLNKLWIRAPGMTTAEFSKFVDEISSAAGHCESSPAPPAPTAHLDDLPAWLEITFKSVGVALQLVSALVAVRALKVSSNSSGIGARVLDRGASSLVVKRTLAELDEQAPPDKDVGGGT